MCLSNLWDSQEWWGRSISQGKLNIFSFLFLFCYSKSILNIICQGDYWNACGGQWWWYSGNGMIERKGFSNECMLKPASALWYVKSNSSMMNNAINDILLQMNFCGRSLLSMSKYWIILLSKKTKQDTGNEKTYKENKKGPWVVYV